MLTDTIHFGNRFPSTIYENKNAEIDAEQIMEIKDCRPLREKEDEKIYLLLDSVRNCFSRKLEFPEKGACARIIRIPQ